MQSGTTQRFFGKYRGKVTNSEDPEQRGRIRVNVPAVPNAAANWALPSVPLAGDKIGLWMIPPVGTNVWVEFEAGNPAAPIWTGCFWEQNESSPFKEQYRNQDIDPTKVIFLKTPGFSLKVDSLDYRNAKTPYEGKKFVITVGEPISNVALELSMEATGITLSCENAGRERSEATKTKVTLKPDQTILMQSAATKVELSPTEIRLLCNPAIATLSRNKGIQLETLPSVATLTPAGIEIKATTPSLKLTPGTIDLTNGAVNLQLSQVAINMNNGALEVV